MKIDITKEYTTRDGREVRLISDEGKGDYPIVGFIEEYSIMEWATNGKIIMNSKSGYPRDLIPKKKKVKCLKSVPELMAEFEGSHFDSYGNLRYLNGSILVNNCSLYLCGYAADGVWSQPLIKEVEED